MIRTEGASELVRTCMVGECGIGQLHGTEVLCSGHFQTLPCVPLHLAVHVYPL